MSAELTVVAAPNWQQAFDRAWLAAERGRICARCGSRLTPWTRGLRDTVTGRLGILFVILCSACDARLRRDGRARRDFVGAARGKMELIVSDRARYRPDTPPRGHA